MYHSFPYIVHNIPIPRKLRCTFAQDAGVQYKDKTIKIVIRKKKGQTLKATYSSDLLTRWTEHELCFFSSTNNNKREKTKSDFYLDKWRLDILY